MSHEDTLLMIAAIESVARACTVIAWQLLICTVLRTILDCLASRK